MKNILSILLCLTSFSALSQITYLADTAFYTDIGQGGAEASCKANHVVYNGWDMTRSNYAWIADAFTVPTGAVWKFDTVIVYGYQYGSTPTSSFTSCNLQIYNDTPGAGGAVIWGDTTTNLLVSTGFTGIYKVDTFVADSGLLSTKRPIMYLKLYLAPHPNLSAGHYWLSWSATGSLPGACVAPDKVLPGRINPPGQVARASYSGSWDYLVDSIVVNGMDMIIKARAGLASVPVVQNLPALVLGQNAPNPFNSETAISYYLPQEGFVKLCVYNTIGQLMATLVNGDTNAGWHHSELMAGHLPAGVYYYQLSTPFGTACKQMSLIK